MHRDNPRRNPLWLSGARHIAIAVSQEGATSVEFESFELGIKCVSEENELEENRDEQDSIETGQRRLVEWTLCLGR